MANHLRNVERGRFDRNRRTARKIYDRVDAAMHGLGQKFDRFSLDVVKSFMPPEQAQQHISLQLAEINNGMAKLTQQEMEQVAFLMNTNGQSLNQFKSVGGRKKRKNHHKRGHEQIYSPNSIRLYLLLIALLLLLVSCQSRPATEKSSTVDSPAALVEQPTAEVPTGPEFAPTTVSDDASEGEEVVEAESPLTEEKETTSPPDEEVTESKYLVYVDALTAEGIEIAVTPETFTDVFEDINIDGDEAIYIAVDETDEENPKFIVVTRTADGEIKVRGVSAKRYTVTQETGAIDFFDDETPTAKPTATLDPITLELSVTPEALPVPTPVIEGEEETDDDGTPVAPEDETDPSDEGEGEAGDIDDNTFIPKEMVEDTTNFPCVKADDNTCGISFTVENKIEYGLYTDENNNVISIPGTPFVIEAAITGWTRNSSGDLPDEGVIIPIIIANTDTGERMTGEAYADAAPQWELKHFLIRLAEFYLDQRGNSETYNHGNSYDERDTWYSNPDANVPTIDQEDSVSIILPSPGDDITGEYLPQQVYEFLQPLLVTYYGENYEALTRYLQTGNIADFVEDMGDKLVRTPDGKVILIPGGGAALVHDRNNN